MLEASPCAGWRPWISFTWNHGSQSSRDFSTVPRSNNGGRVGSAIVGSDQPATPRRRRWRRILAGVAVVLATGLAIVAIQPLWVFDALAWATPGIVWRVETQKPWVALSFDDGPAPDHTPRVLEILARHRAHATFFLIGDRAARFPASVEQLRAAGHEIGNHSYTLSSTLHSTDEELLSNLERTE